MERFLIVMGLIFALALGVVAMISVSSQSAQTPDEGLVAVDATPLTAPIPQATLTPTVKTPEKTQLATVKATDNRATPAPKPTAKAVADDSARAGGNSYRIRILATGSRNANLEPCGCSSPQVGGLDREAWLIDDYRKKEGPFLLLDAGGFTQVFLTKQGRLRAEYMFRGLKALGLDAINVCRDDEQLLGDLIAETFGGAGQPPLLSANLTDRESGLLLYKPYRILEYPLDRSGNETMRIGVVGVSYDDAYDGLAAAATRHRPGFAEPVSENGASDFIAAARAALQELEGECEIKIALGLLSDRHVNQLTREVPGFDLVIYGLAPPSSLHTIWSRKMNNVWTVRTGSALGRYMAKIYIDGDREKGVSSVSAIRVQVLSKLDKKPALTQILAEYKEQVAIQYKQDVARLGRSDKFTYIGSDICAICHRENLDSWRPTAHARALETLVSKSQENNPECLKCHVVGFGVDNGFRSIDTQRHLGGVQCENCHGGGWEHSRTHMQLQRARDQNVTPLPEVAALTIPDAASCQACHQPPHDEDFDFDRDWAIIKHQLPAKKK